MELPVFQFVPIPLFPVTVHHKDSDLWKSSALSRQLTSIFNATAGIKELLGNIFFSSWGSTLKVTEFCGVCYTKLLFLTLTFLSCRYCVWHCDSLTLEISCVTHKQGKYLKNCHLWAQSWGQMLPCHRCTMTLNSVVYLQGVWHFLFYHNNLKSKCNRGKKTSKLRFCKSLINF